MAAPVDPHTGAEQSLDRAPRFGADPELEFRDGRVDRGDGAPLILAMRAEIAEIYAGLELDGAAMPRAGHAELSPPSGAFLVGYRSGDAICCGGVKRLDGRTCEIKRMFVVPAARGRGLARVLLGVLEYRARELGYVVARLDTGPRQPGARRLYESEGYNAIENFNGNPVADFFGEKALSADSTRQGATDQVSPSH